MKREYKVIMLLILVISIVALVLTSSYALFSFEEKGKIENKLVTGVYSSCEYEDGTTWNFDYTGNEQTFTVPCDGEYKLETWGAQGGYSSSDVALNYGGYSVGTSILEMNRKLYLNIGGKGEDYTNTDKSNGGYNGGGYGGVTSSSINNNLKQGGTGGGGDNYTNGSTEDIHGGSGGGIVGTDGGIFSQLSEYHGTGGTQNDGGYDYFNSTNSATFGAGSNLNEAGYGGNGGGGGFYGGGGTNRAHSGGGGGSGYIGNSLLTNKAMYCYNCQESSEESTKTISTTCTSETPTENCSKQGNGYARVTLVKADKPIKKYTETILNGTDPVLKGNLVPIKIASDGTVTKADTSKEWYKYENKEWANAVILKDETKIYNNGDTIPESNIESYFVWIPRFKYQIFDEGNYTGLTSTQNKAQTINVVFENKDTTPSNGTTKDSWLTHPAFTSFDSNGFWVGKFETGYDKAASTASAQVNSVDTSKIIIKPNVYSWRSITIGNAFKNSYDYQRNLDSHMMKNTERGTVAYLQHSVYGSKASVRINNNEAYITGYASTTGNRSGIYDMAGGSWEYVMGYTTSSSTVGGSSGITSIYPNFFSDSTYTKYWDKYTSTTNIQFNNRILGDATGEMGPFGREKDPDGTTRQKSSWYGDYANFVYSSGPWFGRGGFWYDGTVSGAFAFGGYSGTAHMYFSFRIVLTPTI